MHAIELRGVGKTYADGTTAVRDVNLSIEEGEFVVFVGPSGCGKSTLLRMVAGLEEITAGDVFVGGERVNDVAPKDRDIAMVFQSYALYPHMSVYGNVAFPLGQRKTPKSVLDGKVRDVARMLDLGSLLKRKPRALSGGQRQRVAMGRALVREPKAFLLDEPLSNLDAKLRVQMRGELSRLHARLGTTTVYVTHDQVEAMTLGDRVAVFCDGELLQCDRPRALYRTPSSIFVAGFIGSPAMNFLQAVVSDDEDGALLIGSDRWIPRGATPGWASARGLAAGDDVIVGLRPEALTLAPATETRHLGAVVDVVEHVEPEAYVEFELTGGGRVRRADEFTNSGREVDPILGARVVVRIKSDDAPLPQESFGLSAALTDVHLFDPVSGRAMIGASVGV